VALVVLIMVVAVLGQQGIDEQSGMMILDKLACMDI